MALLALARRRRGAEALAALLGWRTVASGAEPPLEAAKEEFRKGVVLFEAGDVEVALEHFRRSRALFPSVKNTMNMAVSLDRLRRHDEALELFEEVLTRFNGELSPEERQQVPGLMAAMRARVGELPWEGTLAPGPHMVQVLRGAVGSAPALATVLQGQTTLLRLRVGPLAALSLRASLPSAQLRLGEVPLGRGSWQGSLPKGTHTLSASEEGYFPRSLSVELPLPSPAPIKLTLLQDLAHPRWPRPPSLPSSMGRH